MATTSDPQADATIAAIAAALPQRPNNPMVASEDSAASPQIKPEHVPDADSPAHDRATLAPMPSMLPVPPMSHPATYRSKLNGPSPQKGSGQDRFRQMMSGRPFPPAPPTIYPQLPGLKPPGTTQLTPAADFYQNSTNGGDGRAASVNPSPLFMVDTVGRRSGNGSSRAESQPAPAYNNAGTTVSNNDTNSNANNNAFFRTTQTSILSSECQSRRFNPQFTEWVGNDGFYYASVKLQDHCIADGRRYTSTNDAKQSLAKQAVQWIRANLPKDPIPTRAAAIAREKQAQLNRERADRDRHHGNGSGNGSGNGLANGYGSGKSAGYSHYSPGRARTPRNNEAVADHKKKSEAQELFERIRAFCGSARGPSEEVLADPAASRAFLEGFALGEKLRESAVRAERRRSRSPKTGGDRNWGSRGYRERSAARRLNSEFH
ncbi:hypothetical protein PG989_004350 [Apiospora arundinis]